MKKGWNSLFLISKLSLTVLPVIFIQCLTLAQQPNPAVISGTVVEQQSKQPLELVNVGLYLSEDSSLVTGTSTAKTGKFFISVIKPGNYYLTLNSLGFQTKIISGLAVRNGVQVQLDTIELIASSIILDDISVIQNQSKLETSIDRKSYLVEKDILGQTGSASDILQNIPSVTVDVDGTVSLRGSSNVTFFINGKPSALLKRNSAMVLQQLPASTIEKIEVITNPSAKYKPDGTGGIINLVLKKDKKQGFNGSVTANVGNHQRHNLGTMLNYNTGKMNIFGNYGFRQNNYPGSSTDYRINRDSTGQVINYFESEGKTYGKPVSHFGNMGFEYEFNQNNKLEITGNINFQNQDRKQNTRSSWKNVNQQITSEYNLFRLNEESEMEWETSAVYSHQFDKEGYELQVELNITGYDETEDNHYTETHTIPSNYEVLSRNLIQKGGPQKEVYVEYVLPIGEETELEAGYVGEFFKDNISYLGENYDATSGKWITDSNKTNDFVFHQNIHALYTTFSHSFDKLSFMAGLRAEQVFITSNLITLDSIVPNNYFKIYPTLHLAYDLNDQQQFQLNYSHRVRRPDSDEMNPFPEYSDPRNMEAGNPIAKPEQIHSVEFGYKYSNEKITIQPTIYYRYRYDAFAEIQRYINDTVLLRTFENLAQDQSLGIEFIASVNPAKWLDINFSTNGFYHTIDASNIGYSENKSSFSVNTKLGADFNITSSTLLQVYAYHHSARLTPQGQYNPVFYTNLGLRQNLFKDKASLILTVSDIFNTLKSESIVDTPELFKKSVRTRDTQIFYIGFNYRFGKNQKKQVEELKFDNSI